MTSLINEKFTLDKFDRRKKAFFEEYEWDFMPFAQKDPLPTPELLVPHQIEDVQKLIDLVLEGDLVSFIVSEIGMGKTTLCRFLEEELPEQEDQDVVSVFLHGPSIESGEQMLRLILKELELKTEKGDIAVQFDQLKTWHQNYPDFLLALIIDEFPDIGKDSLEIVRSLVDLKGIVLILNGQKNELIEFVEDNAPALFQRKRQVLELRPMNRDEIRELIIYRMAWARGGDFNKRSIEPFTEKSIDKIYEKSNGIPRKSLKLAGDSVYNAIERDKMNIDADQVHERDRREEKTKSLWDNLKFWERD